MSNATTYDERAWSMDNAVAVSTAHCIISNAPTIQIRVSLLTNHSAASDASRLSPLAASVVKGGPLDP